MILDTSAIVAILLREDTAGRLIDAMTAASWRGVGAPTVVEAGIVLSARLGRDARPLLRGLFDAADIHVLPFDEDHATVAMAAWRHYGKGRHPAALNLGDCHAYAVAKVSELPLLCVGDDFAQTDLPLA